MAECLMMNKDRDFWNELNRMKRSQKVNPPHPPIDGVSSSKGIACVFAAKFKDMYNSVPSDSVVLDEFRV